MIRHMENHSEFLKNRGQLPLTPILDDLIRSRILLKIQYRLNRFNAEPILYPNLFWYMRPRKGLSWIQISQIYQWKKTSF